MRPLLPFGSRTRQAILALTHLAPEQEFYLRELVRRTGFAPRTVQVELDRLVAAGILRDRRDGNRRYLRASSGHPLFAPLRDIVLKTTGIVPALGDALGSAGVEAAFVFGSVATGTARAESDIDLMVIGSVGQRETVRRLSALQQRLGREINPVVWTAAEYRERAGSADPFLARVLATPRLMVTGTDDDLARLGDTRVAPAARHLPGRNRRAAGKRRQRPG
jgi:predicted nucleotidyltransferase